MHSDKADLDPITVTIREACKISGLGPTTLWKLRKAGRLKTAQIPGVDIDCTTRLSSSNLYIEQAGATMGRSVNVRPAKGSANGGSVSPERKGSKQPLNDWVSPDWSILDDRRGELPDFPLECLGERVRAWVERAARGAGVTVAHVAVPALGIASSLVGMARRVKATSSWLEPVTCWTAVVGASGTGKTPGIDTVKRALAQIERNNRNKDSSRGPGLIVLPELSLRPRT